MTLSDYSSLATVLMALISLIVLLLILRQVNQGERSLRFQVCRDLLAMLEDTKDQRQHLEELAATKTSFSIQDLPSDEQLPYHRLIREWDKVGLLVKHGVVPREFVLDFYSRPIVQSWKHLEPLVTAVRQKRKQPGHRSKFQGLAYLAREYRLKKYPSEITFDVSDDVDARRWKDKWRW